MKEENVGPRECTKGVCECVQEAGGGSIDHSDDAFQMLENTHGECWLAGAIAHSPKWKERTIQECIHGLLIAPCGKMRVEEIVHTCKRKDTMPGCKGGLKALVILCRKQLCQKQ